jgi:5-enolpyruvylshikimate-3-phosphate synthase
LLRYKTNWEKLERHLPKRMLDAGRWSLENFLSEEIIINTYHDHRMAMGLAPLATLTNLKIESPEVVNKSYPGFWDDMKSVGFEIK